MKLAKRQIVNTKSQAIMVLEIKVFFIYLEFYFQGSISKDNLTVVRWTEKVDYSPSYISIIKVKRFLSGSNSGVSDQRLYTECCRF